MPPKDFADCPIYLHTSWNSKVGVCIMSRVLYLHIEEFMLLWLCVRLLYGFGNVYEHEEEYDFFMLMKKFDETQR